MDNTNTRNRILVVDDELRWREIVADFLQFGGFKVITAGSGVEAMAKAAKEYVGIIILDVRLAGEDSAQLAAALKAKHPESLILLYTGLDHTDPEVQRFLREGADRYFRKGSLPALLKYVTDLSGNATPEPAEA